MERKSDTVRRLVATGDSESAQKGVETVQRLYGI